MRRLNRQQATVRWERIARRVARLKVKNKNLIDTVGKIAIAVDELNRRGAAATTPEELNGTVNS